MRTLPPSSVISTDARVLLLQQEVGTDPHHALVGVEVGEVEAVELAAELVGRAVAAPEEVEEEARHGYPVTSR